MKRRNEMKKGTTPARTGWAWRMAGAWLAGGRADTPRTPDATAARPRADAISGEPQRKKRDAPLKRRHPRETRLIKIVIAETCGYSMGGLDNERREGHTLVSYAVNSEMRSTGTPYTSLKYFCRCPTSTQRTAV